MNEQQVRTIAREETNRAVQLHEIRFTLSGAFLGACGLLGYLVATGQF
jgi:hypothetical protein